MSAQTNEQWEQLWLPLWPLASDDLQAGIYRMSRESALGCRYIEANPHAISNLLVVDIDHADSLTRTMWQRRDWLPNAVVENPANGHAHAVWGLKEPVTRTEYGKRKPLAYAAAITEGLRRSVDGDTGYSGLITKNPEHQTWEAHWLTDHLYSLQELEHWLTDDQSMPPESWRRARRKNPVGLGRNCSLFESARDWAYREVRHHWGDPDGLWQAISTAAHTMNASFAEPLSANETRQVAASIHRWLTTKSRIWADGPLVYEATFTTIQSARGRKSGAKRRQEAASRWENV